MKNLLYFLLFVVFACKNETSNTASNTLTPDDQPAVPEAYGIAGADAAIIKILSPESTVYVYPNYKVTTESMNDVAGEKITVFSTTGEEVWRLDNLDGGNFFSGFSSDHVFVDNGTGPDGRRLMVFDLKNKKMGYQDVYIGDPSISGDGVLMFYRPVSGEVAGKVDCPEKEDWKKSGLGVGFGQLNLYSLKTAEFTVKAEFKCFALQ